MATWWLTFVAILLGTKRNQDFQFMFINNCLIDKNMVHVTFGPRGRREVCKNSHVCICEGIIRRRWEGEFTRKYSSSFLPSEGKEGKGKGREGEGRGWITWYPSNKVYRVIKNRYPPKILSYSAKIDATRMGTWLVEKNGVQTLFWY